MGVCFVWVLVCGLMIWFGVLVGVMFGNVWVYFDLVSFEMVVWVVGSGFFNGIGDVFVIVGVVVLVCKLIDFKYLFVLIYNVIVFMVVGVFFGGFVSVLFGVIGLWIFGFVEMVVYLMLFVIWFIGDVIGVLVLVFVIIFLVIDRF